MFVHHHATRMPYTHGLQPAAGGLIKCNRNEPSSQLCALTAGAMQWLAKEAAVDYSLQAKDPHSHRWTWPDVAGMQLVPSSWGNMTTFNRPLLLHALYVKRVLAYMQRSVSSSVYVVDLTLGCHQKTVARCTTLCTCNCFCTPLEWPVHGLAACIDCTRTLLLSA